MRNWTLFVAAFATLWVLLGVSPQAQEAPPVRKKDPYLERLETVGVPEYRRGGLLKTGVPDYEDLRFREGIELELERQYVQTLPLMNGDLVTTDVVFMDVPTTATYARLALPDLVAMALGGNLDLLNERRNVEIARSQTTGSEAFFIPFLDVVANERYTHRREQEVDPVPTPFDPTTTDTKPPGKTVRNTRTHSTDGGLQLTQNLPSGGTITANLDQDREHVRTSTGDFWERSTDYTNNAGVRYLQPLLQGGGFDVGTANLRRTKLSEMNQILTEKMRKRDTVLQVIEQYFQLLQIKRQLIVSKESIAEKLRFLEETKVKYEVGRVAESEILRAEIQWLQDINTAINRRSELEGQRERILETLGLPLETPISFIDITPELLKRGRVDIPPQDEALREAMDTRMELMQSDISIALAEINRKVARNNALPQLDVDGGYKTIGFGDSRHEANDYNDSQWDVGATLKIPLQNIANREAAKRSAISLAQSRTSRQRLELSIHTDVLSAAREVRTTESNLTVLKYTVDQAKRNLELINGSFSVGFASITEVRLAQDDLYDSQTSYDNAVLNYQIALAKLYVALGRPLY